MNAFEKWLEAQDDLYCLVTAGERPASDIPKAAWNAAIAACEAIVKERHDPCEPWLEPGELTQRLEVKG